MTPNTTERTARRTRSERHSRSGRSLISFELPRVPLARHRVGLLAAAGVVALLAVLVVGDAASSWGRIHPGVTIGGVAVGGMSRSDARAAIERDVGPRLRLPVTVVYESRRWTVSPGLVGASLPSGSAAEAAYAVGRTGNLFQQAGQRIGAWFGAEELPLAAQADAGKLDAELAQLKRAVEVEPRDASVAVQGTDVSLQPARPGVAVRSAALTSQLLEAFASPQRIVRMTLGYAPVSVSDEDAKQAYADAKRMVAGDVVLTFQTRTWTVAATDVGRWITFTKVPWSPDLTRTPAATRTASTGASAETTASGRPGQRMVLVARIGADEVSSTLKPLVKGVGKPARDARFVVSGAKITIVPSQTGIGIDVGGLAGTLDRVLRSGGDRRIAMNLTQTPPRVSTGQAQGMGIKELISSFSTDYDPGNAPRVSNIHTLARALDGKLVPPGGEFSFNDAVGERTAAKGYQEAPAIVNGRLVPQLGGGICQIGTTFFNAVFFSGFQVLERTNHSFYISHYPKGRDCTVSWGGPNFRWKNDSKAWVLIHTSYDSGSVTISLYGTDPGYKVSYTTGPFTHVVHYTVETQNDPTLPLGDTVVDGSGVDGRTVVVVRTVTLGGQVVRTDTFKSVYQPENEVTRVGTKPPGSTTATGTPTPSKPTTSH